MLPQVEPRESLSRAKRLGDELRIALVCSPQDADGGADFPVLLAAGEDHSILVEPAVWSDPLVDWEAYDALLALRVWDYSMRASSFRHWLSEREQSSPQLFNSPDLLRWGMDKGFLLELQEMGVLMPQTHLRLSGARSAGDWPETEMLVKKPRLGSGGVGVELLPPRAWHPPERDVLLQSYRSEIADHGEISLTVIDGKPYGQVRRLPAHDDFRVGESWGGSLNAEPVSPAAEALVRQIGELLPFQPLYARFDFWDWQQPYLLADLELVEPDLYLRLFPGSADALLLALRSRLKP